MTFHEMNKDHFRRKKKPPPPTREEVEKAVDEYLRTGGTITVIPYDPSQYRQLLDTDNSNADNFLMGE